MGGDVKWWRLSLLWNRISTLCFGAPIQARHSPELHGKPDLTCVRVSCLKPTQMRRGRNRAPRPAGDDAAGDPFIVGQFSGVVRADVSGPRRVGHRGQDRDAGRDPSVCRSSAGGDTFPGRLHVERAQDIAQQSDRWLGGSDAQDHQAWYRNRSVRQRSKNFAIPGHVQGLSWRSAELSRNLDREYRRFAIWSRRWSLLPNPTFSPGNPG
jgi:hypothetical protein